MSAALQRFFAPVRAGTWWEFKTPVFLGVAYLTAVVGGVSFSELWPALLCIVAALVPLASFVCVINDITDLRDDLRAGKANAMDGRSPAFRALWLFACLCGGGLAAVFCFEGRTAALFLYLANWLVFVLYSVRPFRLKARGLAGVVADATGGQLLPSLWSALLVVPVLPAIFAIPLAVWAFAFGIRGIVYHQVGDLEADLRSEVRTLATRTRGDMLSRVVNRIVFPLEMVALVILLWQSAPLLAASSLLMYTLCQFAMWRWLRVRTCVALPLGCCRMAMLKYYQVWFPLFSIMVLALRDPFALICLPVHAILFPDSWKRCSDHWARIRHNMKYPPDWDNLGTAQP